MLSFDIRSLETQAVVVDEQLSADDAIWEEGDPKPADSVHVTGRLSAAGPGRFYWHGRIEGDVALDAEPERQAHRRDLGKAEHAKLGTAEPQVGEAEQRVAVLVEFDREPSRRAERVEEFHDRHWVRLGLAVLPSVVMGDGVGAECEAQFGRQEDHAAILRSARASAASRWRASSQSAALLACEAARKIARLSSRSTSSHEPI